jgi:predicted ATPase/class 3 adenylate cyclase
MKPVSRELPAGTVTFLFTDVEGSTKLLHELGAEGYAAALAEHRRVLREAFAAHGGVEVDTQGDAFFVAFSGAPDALAAAREGQEALAPGPIRVRIGLHTGRPTLTEEGYFGADVHLGARIAAAGHGGQVLLSKATRELVDGEVSDLGEHRVKDFAEPVWLFELGSERFPPLKTISNTNLPRPASSFVGREREVEEVVAQLRDGTRLLTLTGAGGSGKTRLAIEAAAELVPEFKNGVFWVALAALRKPALVAETIALTLGAKGGLAEHIGERELLLLLDNLEQVIDAAPELAALVESCANLKLLVTSRELLRVRGEVQYAVPPLAEQEAVALFCQRSHLEVSDEIAELCRRLDNLPLAVELAAARASVLSPAQILERLSRRLDLLKGGRDTDPRQQTLRATIEWSYDLLSPEERQLFARLAVFRGGCTLEAAEEVADADLDVLQSLVDKSLLRHTRERFWMLETIREYAAARIEESDEAEEVRQRHAECFLALAEEAEPYLRRHWSRQWLDRLELEHDSLRAALDQLEASGQSELALRMAGAIWWFWDGRGHLAEGRRRLESALQADERPTAARARALNGAAALAVDGGDPSAARLRAEEGLALQRALGDNWGAAYSVYLLAHAALSEADWPRAQRLFEESLRLFGELGDEHYTLDSKYKLAWTHEGLGDRERARAVHGKNLLQARAAHNDHMVAGALGMLARYAIDEGEVDDAVSLLKESHRINRDFGAHSRTAKDLRTFARVLAVKGRAATAARILSCAMARQQEMGFDTDPFAERFDEETLSTIRLQLDEAALAEAWEQGRALALDDAGMLALDSLGAARATGGPRSGGV